MATRKHWLMTGAAVIAALGIGFGAARLFDSPSPAADSHTEGEEGHSDEEAPEGFVALTEQEAVAAGVTLTGLQRGGGTELRLPGHVSLAPGAEARVDAPLAGTVTAVHVGPGARVRRGTVLVTLRSPEGAAARADADTAAAEAEAARAALTRDETLFERGYMPRARLDVTRAEARSAEARLRSARARVAAFGNPGSDGVVVVRSPADGVVTRLIAAPGVTLHEEALQVAEIADTGRAELVFDAPPSAARLLTIGSTLRAETADGAVLQAVVVAVAPATQGGTATIRATAQGAAPAPGTVLSARLPVGGGNGLTVPADAVQTVEGVTSIFVREGDGFRARPVTVGATAGGRTEILSGLTGSERIAGAGAFVLKAELAKGEAEHGH
ncbi:efflux RND transporter periplasmic adaptor subunit [Brevundimonas sp. M20]|uniref:efflux RND transporter periplasmic adaptor subunit n=1 Tax=Brevundimonas sp. M20 TaxID=2591463 RepID=UPI001146BA94|nr:efflux RND transporter periplasmic adaptor subunit [Brevundimonas sp. M20]QDH73928.1 efflux RND transporter periplasmic adaptor subunit [Brevundimonas sp. M20]